MRTAFIFLTAQARLFASLLAVWVSAGQANTFGQVEILWTTGEATGTWPGSSRIAFSPDSGSFAVVAERAQIQLRWATNGLVWRAFPPEETETDVLTVTFSPDGTLLASGGGLGCLGCGQPVGRDAEFSIRVRHIVENRVVGHLTGHSNVVNGIAFSPDGSLLVSASLDRTVRLWRTADWTLLRTLVGHTNEVFCVAFSPDGTLVASGSADATVKLWRVSDGALLHTLQGLRHQQVLGLAFTPDGKRLLAATYGHILDPDLRQYIPGAVYVWRVVDGAKIDDLARLGNGEFYPCVAVTPDGRTAVAGGANWPLLFFRLSTPPALTLNYNANSLVSSVTVSPDGRFLAYQAGGTVVARMPITLGGPQIRSKQFQFDWHGGSGVYQVQQTTSLTAGAWANLGAPTAATNLAVPMTNPAAFFRVQSLTNGP